MEAPAVTYTDHALMGGSGYSRFIVTFAQVAIPLKAGEVYAKTPNTRDNSNIEIVLLYNHGSMQGTIVALNT